ncbi:hypothetical protein QA644_01340 [Rhizobium sp. CC1099]|nr:hypothetical protein [Rhizobium sp. CC1099]WFU87772.1 hypothetical protein QA644_01340 [Rhizobium sp. CC1099]
MTKNEAKSRGSKRHALADEVAQFILVVNEDDVGEFLAGLPHELIKRCHVQSFHRVEYDPDEDDAESAGYAEIIFEDKDDEVGLKLTTVACPTANGGIGKT